MKSVDLFLVVSSIAAFDSITENKVDKNRYIIPATMNPQKVEISI